MDIVRHLLLLGVMTASGVMAIQLLFGRWLFLVVPASDEKSKNHGKGKRGRKKEFWTEDDVRVGRFAGLMMAACGVACGSLLMFAVGRATDGPALAWWGTTICNVALAAYVVFLVLTVFLRMKSQVKHGGQRTFFDGSNTRLMVLLVATCAVLLILSLLFA